MHLAELVNRQAAADRRRGFALDFDSEADRYAQLAKDLVGLMGEIGEFANLVKKLELRLEHEKYAGPSFEDAVGDLREELADATIYIMRLSVLIGADFEQDILKKMAQNEDRYKTLESD
jgi:NTP pyrophosphatase (non-canonical NTP hydrolase)